MKWSLGRLNCYQPPQSSSVWHQRPPADQSLLSEEISFQGPAKSSGSDNLEQSWLDLEDEWHYEWPMSPIFAYDWGLICKNCPNL